MLCPLPMSNLNSIVQPFTSTSLLQFFFLTGLISSHFKEKAVIIAVNFILLPWVISHDHANFRCMESRNSFSQSDLVCYISHMCHPSRGILDASGFLKYYHNVRISSAFYTVDCEVINFVSFSPC